MYRCVYKCTADAVPKSTGHNICPGEAMKTDLTLRRYLAEFICTTSFNQFSDNDILQAKRCVLDMVGVALAGVKQKASNIMREVFTQVPDEDGATLWGAGRKLPVATAALANAVQAHAIDMDDGHRFANGHPGTVTIPPAVALAEQLGLNGRQLMEAIIIGYEMFIRLGTTANPDLLMRGYHTTSVIGVFASAAAAAKLLGLTVEQTENALSLAGLQSAGLLEALTSGETGKSFQVGKTSQAGVLAALMAQNGADGPVLVFEGEKGFFRALAGKECDIRSICEGLGERFSISSVYFKKHAACRHIHPPLDAMAEIMARENLDPDEIESIVVDTYLIANRLTGHVAAAGSELAAKFSMPVTLGLYLVFGETGPTAYTDSRISDPRVRSIAEKVSIRVNPARDVHYPARREANVTVVARGERFEREIAYPKGEPENPLSDEEFLDKYTSNALRIYTEKQAAMLRHAILDLDNIDVRQMTAFLGTPDA